MSNEILKASQDRKWVITIIYQKGNVITKRNIKVLSMDNNTIKAYCYLRQGVRIFQRENILAAEFYNSKAERFQVQQI